MDVNAFKDLAEMIEMLFYAFAAVGSIWVGDKAWWHAKRFRNARNGRVDDSMPSAYGSRASVVSAIERSIGHSKRTTEAVEKASQVQSDIVRLNGQILDILHDQETKIEETLLQTKLNAKSLEMIERRINGR